MARKTRRVNLLSEPSRARSARMIENDGTNINDAYGECGMSGYVLMRFYNVNGFLRVRATLRPLAEARSLLPPFFSRKAKILSC